AAFGGALSTAPAPDGRSLGGFLAHRLVCAVRLVCRDGDATLAAAYGARDAALVRDHAPDLVYEPGERELPVDYRRCRARACSYAPNDPDLDAHRSGLGAVAPRTRGWFTEGGGPTWSTGSTTPTRTPRCSGRTRSGAWCAGIRW